MTPTLQERTDEARRDLEAAARRLAGAGRTTFTRRDLVTEARRAGSTAAGHTLRATIGLHLSGRGGPLVRVGPGRYRLAGPATDAPASDRDAPVRAGPGPDVEVRAPAPPPDPGPTRVRGPEPPEASREPGPAPGPEPELQEEPEAVLGSAPQLVPERDPGPGPAGDLHLPDRPGPAPEPDPVGGLSAEPGPGPEPEPRAEPEPEPAPAWWSATAVRGAVVGAMTADGWRISDVDSAASDAPWDMAVVQRGTLLLIGVEGYPATAGDGTAPAGADGRARFADAVLAALEARSRVPRARVATAVPDVEALRALASSVAAALAAARVEVWFVDAAGGVRAAS